ncbi:hypothetical protein ACFHWW_07545 [Ensifer sp. P24N7]|uniref:hypothetical protein n=1 Tax=Sinorhizobium sp. P24N7 TaxID=3348358 RepID=UPI0035F34495
MQWLNVFQDFTDRRLIHCLIIEQSLGEGAETKQPFINIVRQFIQKVVIGKTPGHQPASLEVHGRIASILAAMEAATIMEKQFEALARHDYLEKLRTGELDTEQKQKKSHEEALRDRR